MSAHTGTTPPPASETETPSHRLGPRAGAARGAGHSATAAARWAWLAGGACGGALLLLLVVCYCRLMPRQHNSFDKQHHKENHTLRECSHRDDYRAKHAKVEAHARPPAPPRPPRAGPPPAAPAPPGERDLQPQPQCDHYASSTMLLEEAERGADGAGGAWSSAEALRTRSLPAFLRPRARPRPLSDADADTHLFYSKVSASKKHRSRMRSEHAAVIALSKSRGQLAPRAGDDAVIVYDQRTQL